MPTKPTRRGQDRKRVSSQKHEVSYAGKKVGKNGAKAVRKTKAKRGRTTSRPKVMAEARLAQVRSKAKRLVDAIEKLTAA
ncbi:MAG TPA: hypothetical protein VHO24_20360 [Opitutaceae bacterium]|nr:hypothetical protein [Opitutaceae bacterium]